jgi:hypothetical protein
MARIIQRLYPAKPWTCPYVRTDPELGPLGKWHNILLQNWDVCQTALGEGFKGIAMPDCVGTNELPTDGAEQYNAGGWP